MKFDARRVLEALGLEIAPEGHQHTTGGWVNIHCPFCSPPNFHLGISEDGAAAHCWRCGSHPVIQSLAAASGLSYREIKAIIQRHSWGTAVRKPKPVVKEESPRVLRLPPHHELDERGRAYLMRRGFDPELLRETWNLKQTAPVSMLDGVNYGNRILIPIWWDNCVVSFQARDITGTSDKRYLACPAKYQIVPPKNLVYARQDLVSRYPAIIVVEGVTDVWRFGPAAAATLGINFSIEQVLVLSKMHHRFFVVFDNEPAAQKQAEQLCVRLRALGARVDRLTVPADPGDMTEEEAREFLRELRVIG